MLLGTLLLQAWPWGPPPPPPKATTLLDQWGYVVWAGAWVGLLFALLVMQMPARAAHFCQVYCDAWDGFSTTTVSATNGTAKVGAEGGDVKCVDQQKQPPFAPKLVTEKKEGAGSKLEDAVCAGAESMDDQREWVHLKAEIETLRKQLQSLTMFYQTMPDLSEHIQVIQTSGWSYDADQGGWHMQRLQTDDVGSTPS